MKNIDTVYNTNNDNNSMWEQLGMAMQSTATEQELQFGEIVDILSPERFEEKVMELALDIKGFIDAKKVEDQNLMDRILRENTRVYPAYMSILDGKAKSCRDAARLLLGEPEIELGYVGEGETGDTPDQEYRAFQRMWEGKDSESNDNPVATYGVYRYKDYMSKRDEWFGHSVAQWDLAQELKSLRLEYKKHLNLKKMGHQVNHILARLAYLGKDRAECLEISKKTLNYMRKNGQIYRTINRA